MPVRIVTDSACDLDDDQVGAYEIEIVPLSIRFGPEEFVDRQELSSEDFYRRMAQSPHFPETAAPSVGAFEAAFRRAKDAGADAVVCVNLSAGLSATMQSAQNAAKALEGEVDVRVVDSKSVTTGLAGSCSPRPRRRATAKAPTRSSPCSRTCGNAPTCTGRSTRSRT